jgi:hypothetical protein
MKKCNAITALFILLVFSACMHHGSKQLTGIWQLTVMNMNGTKLEGNSLGVWRWEFNDEGGYLVDVAGAREKGTYTLKDDKLTLKSITYKERPETVYKVAKLDSTQLELIAESEKNRTTLNFIKTEKGVEAD